MLVKFIDIKGLKLKSLANDTATVTDLILDEDHKITAVIADFGTLLTDAPEAVPFTALALPDIEAGIWDMDGSAPQKVKPHRRVTDLTGISLSLTDGEFGKVKDLVFNLKTGALAFLVVETGTWLSARQVLIPAAKLGEVDHEAGVAEVSATQNDVENAPDVHASDVIETRAAGTLLTYYGLAA